METGRVDRIESVFAYAYSIDDIKVRYLVTFIANCIIGAVEATWHAWQTFLLLLIVSTHTLAASSILLPVVNGVALQAVTVYIASVASDWAFYTEIFHFNISAHAFALESIWILLPELSRVADVALCAIFAFQAPFNGTQLALLVGILKVAGPTNTDSIFGLSECGTVALCTSSLVCAFDTEI